MMLKEEASNFLLWDFKKWNFSAHSRLTNLAAIWLESSLERLFMNGLHYFSEHEQDWTSRYKRVYYSALQAMKHGSREQP